MWAKKIDLQVEFGLFSGCWFSISALHFQIIPILSFGPGWGRCSGGRETLGVLGHRQTLSRSELLPTSIFHDDQMTQKKRESPREERDGQRYREGERTVRILGSSHSTFI